MTDSGVKNPLAALDLQDKMTAIGATALAIFLFFPWYSIDIPKEAGALGWEPPLPKAVETWYGKLSLLLAVLTALWVAVPALRGAIGPKLPPGIRPLMAVLLSGLAFLFGPLWFFMDAQEGGGMMGMKVGKSFWFFLALLGGAAAVGGAVWKMMEAKKKPAV